MRVAIAALFVAVIVLGARALSSEGAPAFPAHARDEDERAPARLAEAPEARRRQAGDSGDARLQASRSTSMPSYTVDPFWPKPLPNHWLVGAVAGVAVDAQDHVWITHRPSTLQPNETRSGWKAAPPVLEFDRDGTLISAWGGPGDGYEWPQLEHGIYVDRRDHVWLGGGGEKDAQILEFTRQGKFLM